MTEQINQILHKYWEVEEKIMQKIIIKDIMNRKQINLKFYSVKGNEIIEVVWVIQKIEIKIIITQILITYGFQQ